MNTPSGPAVRYRSADEDSARWVGFPFRDDDIVVSTRSKSGTTWVQYLCLLLVHGSPDLPAPLATLSPWLDWLVVPREEVWAQLAAQPHRRVLKTHTPLDGLPLHPGATYVVVARHPLDMAVSLHHQGANLDRARMRELTGSGDGAGVGAVDAPPPPVDEALRRFIAHEADPQQELDSLDGVLHHLTDAWARRDDPHVVLVHYDDLRADLDAEARRLADRLGVTVADDRWPDLVAAASFERMRARAAELAPDPAGVFKDPAAFFRRGSSGAGRALLGPADLQAYEERARDLAPPDLLAWLHRDGPR